MRPSSRPRNDPRNQEVPTFRHQKSEVKVYRTRTRTDPTRNDPIGCSPSSPRICKGRDVKVVPIM